MDDFGTLVAKQEVSDTIINLFVGTDERNWPAVLECFAPRLSFDMSSLTGAQPGDVLAKEVIAGWEKGLAPLAALHHQAGNFRVEVDGDRATAFCYAIASHYLPNPSGRNTRVFVGSYDFSLARDGSRWRITAFRFNLKYVDGNLELEKSGLTQPT